MTLKWPDRRPIATVFLCNSAWGLPKNPRGWFQGNKDVDVTTPGAWKKFGAKLMAYADNCVVRMKKMNAQGVIVWDVEGEEMPHAISYIGDPRTLPKTAPEMDRFADAFMKKFSDAGFKLGVTIRPTEVYQPGIAGKPAWDHRRGDPGALMSAKIRSMPRNDGSLYDLLSGFQRLWQRHDERRAAEETSLHPLDNAHRHVGKAGCPPSGLCHHTGVVREDRLCLQRPTVRQLGPRGHTCGYPPHMARGVPCDLLESAPLGRPLAGL